MKGVFPCDLHVGLAVIDSPEVAALIDSAGITLGSANRHDVTISLLIRKQSPNWSLMYTLNEQRFLRVIGLDKSIISV